MQAYSALASRAHVMSSRCFEGTRQLATFRYTWLLVCNIVFMLCDDTECYSLDSVRLSECDVLLFWQWLGAHPQREDLMRL